MGGGILCLAMLGIDTFGSSMTEYIEKIGAVATSVIWTIGLAVITFGEGPGHSLGNLFFATWGGFITSVLITADCFRDSITRRARLVAGNDPSYDNNQIEMQGTADLDDNDI